METFGIWNLLKTLLSNDVQDTKNVSSANLNTPSTQAETTPNGDKTPTENRDFPPELPTRANACEEYLLRHERIKNGKKR